MASTNDCVSCRNRLGCEAHLRCYICKSTYDLSCANVSSNSYALMDANHKTYWKCPECRSKEPKFCNINTAVLPTSCSEVGSQDDAQGDPIITARKKPAKSPPKPSQKLPAKPKPQKRKRSPANSQPQSSSISVSSTEESNVAPPSSTAELKLQGSQTLVTEGSLREILQQEMTKALKSTLEKLVKTEFSNIHNKIDTFRESLEFMNIKFEEMKAGFEEKTIIINDLKRDNELLKSTVHDLSVRLNTVELHMRDSNIEINGVPEHRSENLVNTVLQLSKTVESPLSESDIQYATRVAKMSNDTGRPRPVIVKLRSARHRDTVLAATAKFNKKHADGKLSSQHLGIGGPRQPIFVSEHLTPANKSLHAAARKKAKEMAYKFVWVRNGRIFVRKEAEFQSILIKNLDSLNLMI